jgi:hypothetical protein
MAQGFATIAPYELKRAVLQGGLDRICPQLQSTTGMVDNVLQSLFLSSSAGPTMDRAKLERLVENTINFVLKDVQESLATPEVRLHWMP